MQHLQVIKINDSGTGVESWQDFLIGQGYDISSDGNFGPQTKTATMDFQSKNNIQPDGIVGNKTFGVAMQLGFNGVVDNSIEITSASFPSKPNFPPLVTNQSRQHIFGSFNYIPDPQPNDPEQIKITDGWDAANMIIVNIPQLTPVKGTPKVQFHRLAAQQLTKLWSDWEAANLLYLVLAWDGSFNPRFVRGSTTLLSNHSFGSAFDINANWNSYGAQPALVGQKGSVRLLVQIANNNGFYWGGHFTKQDGMHFEIAKLL